MIPKESVLGIGFYNGSVEDACVELKKMEDYWLLLQARDWQEILLILRFTGKLSRKRICFGR